METAIIETSLAPSSWEARGRHSPARSAGGAPRNRSPELALVSLTRALGVALAVLFAELGPWDRREVADFVRRELTIGRPPGRVS